VLQRVTVTTKSYRQPYQYYFSYILQRKVYYKVSINNCDCSEIQHAVT